MLQESWLKAAPLLSLCFEVPSSKHADDIDYPAQHNCYFPQLIQLTAAVISPIADPSVRAV
jgi:hypothetical protein